MKEKWIPENINYVKGRIFAHCALSESEIKPSCGDATLTLRLKPCRGFLQT